ncbi:MAG: TetR/AcrR family transcriptional regulator [Acidimicrobiia bacterium]
MASTDTPDEGNEPVWRQRAVSRSLNAARSRAEQRVQRYLDAAFELIDEKGTTEFTIQEVIDRSKQSLRGFYQYFDGKDELLFALLEETVLESIQEIRSVVESETDAIARLRAAVIRLHEWCDPADVPPVPSTHNRRPISEFSPQLAVADPARVGAALGPIVGLLVELLDAAVAAGALHVADTYHAAALIQQTVIHSWTNKRFVEDPRRWVSAEETWEFCLHGLGG